MEACTSFIILLGKDGCLSISTVGLVLETLVCRQNTRNPTEASTYDNNIKKLAGNRDDEGSWDGKVILSANQEGITNYQCR